LKARIGGAWVDVGGPGPGVPAGGTADQVLTKTDSVDFNTKWSTVNVPTINEATGGVRATIAAGQQVNAFTALTIPGVLYRRLVTVRWTQEVSGLTATSNAVMMLRNASDNSTYQTFKIAGNGAASGICEVSLFLPSGPSAGFYCTVQANGGTVDIWVDGFTNRLQIVAVPA
jgi:hypothetical protein